MLRAPARPRLRGRLARRLPDGRADRRLPVRCTGSAICNVDVGTWLTLYSDADDISIGNPFGPFAMGRVAVPEAGSRAASHDTDGRIHGFDRIATHASNDLARIVEVERLEVGLDHAPEKTALRFRVTNHFRREVEGWRLVHRHADPITTVRQADALCTP